MVEIRYGKPGKQLQQEAREGLEVLGGCSPGKERWSCASCGFRMEDIINK